jgi:hypothetical protein
MLIFRLVFGLLLLASLLCFAMSIGTGQAVWRRRGMVVLKWAAWAWMMARPSASAASLPGRPGSCSRRITISCTCGLGRPGRGRRRPSSSAARCTRPPAGRH